MHYEHEVEGQVRAALAAVSLDPYVKSSLPVVTELMWQGRIAAARTVADVAEHRMYHAEGRLAVLDRQLEEAQAHIRRLEVRLWAVSDGCRRLGGRTADLRVESEEIARIATLGLSR